MMSILGALHTIAAQRGEGLLPEFADLLNRPRVSSEADCASTGREVDDEEARRRPSGAVDAIPGQEPEFSPGRRRLSPAQVIDPIGDPPKPHHEEVP
jgi:hypothetical protein